MLEWFKLTSSLQCHDRIERPATCIRQTNVHTRWSLHCSIAAYEFSPIGLVTGQRQLLVAADQEVKQYRRRIIRASWSPGEQLATNRRDEFAPDKQLAEGRVSLIIKRRCEYHFPVAGKGQAARPVAQIADCQSANLDIIARCDDGFHAHADIMIATMEFRHMAMECDFILIRNLSGWLSGCRPELTIFFVLHIYP